MGHHMAEPQNIPYTKADKKQKFNFLRINPLGALRTATLHLDALQ